MKLRFTNFELSHSNKQLIEQLNLELDFQKLYIKGKNGVGKTSLLNAISGTFKYKGKLVFSPSVKKIIHINQEVRLIPEHSIRDNILILCRKEYKQVETMYLNEYQMLTPKTKVNVLSGGQKQLLNFLIAYYNTADLLLIDEPLNNLDNSKVKLVKRLIKEDDRPQIITSHVDIEMEAKVIVIKEKEIVAYES